MAYIKKDQSGPKAKTASSYKARGTRTGGYSHKTDDSDRPRKYSSAKPGAYSRKTDDDRPARKYSENKFGGYSHKTDDSDRPRKYSSAKPGAYSRKTDDDRPASRSFSGRGYSKKTYDEGYGKKRPQKNFKAVKLADSKPYFEYEDDAFSEQAKKAGFETVIGRNAVKEAIKNQRNIIRLYYYLSENDHALYETIKKAKTLGYFITETDKRKLDRLCDNANHQGVVAICSPLSFCDLDELFEVSKQAGEAPFFVLLDKITDPHNVGAIIRSAHQLGAHGIIIGKRRSALIAEGVYKSSAGSVEYVKIAQVNNLSQTVIELKKRGVSIIGSDLSGTDYRKIDYTVPVCLVVGSEGEGMSQNIAKQCDQTALIPMKGKIDSLNASVAAGIILSEAAYQRG